MYKCFRIVALFALTFVVYCCDLLSDFIGLWTQKFTFTLKTTKMYESFTPPLQSDDDPFESQMFPEIEDYILDEKEYLAKYEEWKKNKVKKHEPEYYVKRLLEILNCDPPQRFIKRRNVGTINEPRMVSYIPKDKVLFLLYKTFGVFWVNEIRSHTLIINTPVTICRLHYKVPNTNIWLFKDGIGGSPLIQSKSEKKDTPISSLMGLKESSVTLASPISESQSFKRAAHWLGKLFGAGLDVDDYWDFKGAWDPDEEKHETKKPNENENSKQYNQSSNDDYDLSY